MVIKKKEEKTLLNVMKEHHAVFSLTLTDGFANISFNDKAEPVVQLFDEDGVCREDAEYPGNDIQQVGKFLEEMSLLRLKEYKL